ncbi:MAG: hypothetical protein CSB47_01340 [Proteobacteria bacterium]|nr:MAG: hypothetical protein CSB47_01340 [Pseudomonadota bacterium]
MKTQIKHTATIAAILMVGFSTTALADCQWTHGSLGVTIQATSDRLKQYATCEKNCHQLEVELTKTIDLMNTAYRCPPGVLTAKNRQMIDFFNSRFKLIKKQKQGRSAWQQPKPATVTTTAPTKPTHTKPVVAAPASKPPQTKMQISGDAYQALWLEDDSPAARPQRVPAQAAAPRPRPPARTQVAAPQRHVPAPAPQTKMTISPEAYQALWLEKNEAAISQQAKERAQFAQVRKLREMQIARQREHDKQRKTYLQKQALIRQQNLKKANARKQMILHQYNQQRMLHQQQLQQRVRANQQRLQQARQQRLARHH